MVANYSSYYDIWYCVELRSEVSEDDFAFGGMRWSWKLYKHSKTTNTLTILTKQR